MRMKIHTKGWRGSDMAKKGEEPGAMFGAFLEIDGELYDMVNDIEVNFGEAFASVTCTFIPGQLEIVTHTQETWPKLEKELRAKEGRLAARNAEGRVIAVYVSPKPDEE